MNHIALTHCEGFYLVGIVFSAVFRRFFPCLEFDIYLWGIQIRKQVGSQLTERDESQKNYTQHQHQNGHRVFYSKSGNCVHKGYLIIFTLDLLLRVSNPLVTTLSFFASPLVTSTSVIFSSPVSMILSAATPRSTINTVFPLCRDRIIFLGITIAESLRLVTISAFTNIPGRSRKSRLSIETVPLNVRVSAFIAGDS